MEVKEYNKIILCGFPEDLAKKLENYKGDLTREIIEKQELRCLKNHYETSYKDF